MWIYKSYGPLSANDCRIKILHVHTVWNVFFGKEVIKFSFVLLIEQKVKYQVCQLIILQAMQETKGCTQ